MQSTQTTTSNSGAAVTVTPAAFDPNTPYDRHAAAAYLGLAYNTLRCMATKGTGPVFYRLGRKCVYLRADLDAYREAGRVTASQQEGV